jgi:hypothetical protein
LGELKILILESVVREGEKLVLAMAGDMKDKQIKLWVDDIRVPSKDYFWIKTVRETIIAIQEAEHMGFKIIEISLDHDAGDYGPPDYIRILDWLEETGRNYPIHIHSQNPVGVENMRRIIEKNGWKEVR